MAGELHRLLFETEEGQEALRRLREAERIIAKDANLTNENIMAEEEERQEEERQEENNNTNNEEAINNNEEGVNIDKYLSAFGKQNSDLIKSIIGD